jgi:hypothetical protein
VTLLELIVALFVLTTAMTAIVQLLAVAAKQRRMLEERRVALAEVANQAERIALLPWNKLQPSAPPAWELSEASRKALPRATTAMEIVAEAEPVESRRIRLLVKSVDAAGQPVELADLTVWKFAPGGEP